jgi:hypothetical protein
MTDCDNFYRDLTPLSNFADVAEASNYAPAPNSWWVMISDVVDSTKAIEKGRYKEVNIVGALGIIALLNTAQNFEFPFVFGGDGASAVIPSRMLEDAKRVMAATRSRAKEAFDLELRIGFVPISDVSKPGIGVNIAKIRTSPHYVQAAFNGGGLSLAEHLVKDPQQADTYTFAESDPNVEADFTGLECRWKPIPSPAGETLSLLVQSTAPQGHHSDALYREILEEIESILGRGDQRHPVHQQSLELSPRKQDLAAEHKAKTRDRSRISSKVGLLWKQLETTLGKFAFSRRLKLPGFDTGTYQDSLVANCDFQKFDDMIRMVVSCSTNDRRSLEKYLKSKRTNNEIVYGMHVSKEALLTCLVFDRQHKHFHFVDGSNGGYALAAKGLKQQLREIKGNASPNSYKGTPVAPPKAKAEFRLPRR